MSIIEFLNKQEWFTKQGTLSAQKTNALEAIDAFFKEKKVNLDKQPQNFIQAILADLNEYTERDFGTPDTIFKRALERFESLSPAHIHAQHHARAAYDNKPLNQCPTRLLMTTEHLQEAMPKSTDEIQVLATIGANPTAWESVQAAAINALATGKRVIFPIQQYNHFRLVVANPSEDPSNPVQVELFDSMGEEHAKAAIALVTQFFNGVNIEIVTNQPTHLQKDGYSCGDYVAARAHQIMGHETPLVKALDAQGNNNDALREVIRGSLEEYDQEEHQAHSTHQDKLIETLVSSSNVRPEMTEQYKAILKSLIDSKDTIFQNAKDITDANKTSLTDEEIATIEQANEFKKAGL